ncbi:galactoside permease [Raoultella terrigena]|uniref:Galactoside permease n=1 Tax=Raoultella terrigena TaxID=577 RepID=A0A485CFC1_RAOTE|nr:galactoside permease [Raoultella terrigena]
MLESYTERVARRAVEFARRGCGDRWLGGGDLFAGLLFNINPKLNFAVASCSGLVFFFLLARLRVSSAPQAMEEAVAGGKVTLGGRAASAHPAPLLGAGVFRRRHLYLRRL